MSVCIIGGGVGGLGATKAALEEGLKPTLLEKSPTIGGLWKRQEGVMWDSLQTNISKYSCMFSDYPWDKKSDLFPNQKEVLRYLEGYAETFKLNPYIHLEAEAKKIEREGTKWKVEWLENGTSHTQIFDHMVIASGIYTKPFIPEISRKEKFKGTILHSSGYRSPLAFQGKTVAVIGNGNSGAEIAAELLQDTSIKVIHVAKRTYYTMPRRIVFNEKKYPIDFLFYSRFADSTTKQLSSEAKNKKNHHFFHTMTGAGDPQSTAPAFVAVSENYLEQIKSGLKNSKEILTKGEISVLTEKGFRLKDGREFEADSIIFSTGYETVLPFFSQDILDALSFQPQDRFQPLLLHKATWSILPNLAFVGMNLGPFFSTSELQARWAMSVFSGHLAMPPQETILKGIEEEKKIRELTPRAQYPHGDYVNFADQLASELNLLPNFDELLLKNSELHKKLWKGPLLPAHYRLYGRHSKFDLAMQIIDEASSINN